MSDLQFARDDKKKVFASYHFTSKDMKYNGFGNYIGEFDIAAYHYDPAKFIQDLEKSISMSVSEQLKMEVNIKVLFFR